MRPSPVIVGSCCPRARAAAPRGSAVRYESTVGRSAVERLERRLLLAVSTDAQGWTVVTPPADARVVYVSSSAGNDDNAGLSPDLPVRSLKEGISRLRDKSGDQLLLRRGWQESLSLWVKSGRSADQPIVVGAYGTGDRPVLETGTATRSSPARASSTSSATSP